VFHPVDKTGRAEELQPLITGKENPHYAIEAAEMVHVGMGNKDMAEPEDFARRQKMQITQVKEDRPLLELEVDVESRVIKGAIHQTRVE